MFGSKRIFSLNLEHSWKFYLVRNFMIHNHRHQLLVSSASCYRVKKQSGLTKCYNAPVFHSAAHVRNCNQIWNIVSKSNFFSLLDKQQLYTGPTGGLAQNCSFTDIEFIYQETMKVKKNTTVKKGKTITASLNRMV